MQTYPKAFVHFLIILSLIQTTKSCSNRKEIVFYDPSTRERSEKIEESREFKSGELPTSYKRQYDALISANAPVDVAKSVKNGDYRYVAISAYAYFLPGIAEADWLETIYKKKNVKVIVGTSDMIISEWPDLQGAAYDYALEYN